MSIAMGGMLRDAGEGGLDLAKFGTRGALMAATMGVLSLPLIPREDYAAFYRWAARKARLLRGALPRAGRRPSRTASRRRASKSPARASKRGAK